MTRPAMADFDSAGFDSSDERSAHELRRRLADDSFLFFRALLDPSAVAEVRRQVLLELEKVGWLAPGVDPAAALPGPVAHHDRGTMNGAAVEDPGWREGYQAVQSIEALHRLAHGPALLDVLRAVLGAPVVVHPRKIARISFPRLNFPTPPHQDALFNQIPSDVLTVWIPLGDCPDDLGSLRVLRGSANLGVLPVAPDDGLGGESVAVPAGAGDWVGDDYRCGDVMIFHSRTVHMTTPNVGGTLRLSMDCRFQSAADPVKLAALLPHGYTSGRLPGWRELTRGWTSTRWVEPGHPVRVVAVSSGPVRPPRLVAAGCRERTVTR
ncbi:phytanoyl-CoA dioxygenase family protein [Nonomuraea lactucae]|uniref:phytanoyl-CoA dioxygenase family protein n=1 Tax=Nonomuraea lactucae TaxID=2249762 RepID=UPI0013B43CF1|nr:phytanoyl-CoA dioxygenase family protein [Nonomuraea lactucae]